MGAYWIMMGPSVLTTLTCPTGDAMTALGFQLGGVIAPAMAPPPGGEGRVILLEGAVGAGKTTFARGLIRALTHEDEDVPSPSFALVQLYTARAGGGRGWPIYHIDLYRLQDPDEIWELGVEDAFEDGLVLIEWPENALPVLPRRHRRAALRISIEGIAERRLNISTQEPSLWRALVETAYKGRPL